MRGKRNIFKNYENKLNITTKQKESNTKSELEEFMEILKKKQVCLFFLRIKNYTTYT